MLQVQCECRVVQFDGLWSKGVFQSVGFALGEKQPSSERAPLCDDDSMQRVTGSVHNSKKFFQGSPLCMEIFRSMEAGLISSTQLHNLEAFLQLGSDYVVIQRHGVSSHFEMLQFDRQKKVDEGSVKVAASTCAAAINQGM